MAHLCPRTVTRWSTSTTLAGHEVGSAGSAASAAPQMPAVVRGRHAQPCAKAWGKALTENGSLERLALVLRLDRLGVDKRAQGLGIGKALLAHVLGIAIEQRDRIGCVGVVTDAKTEAESFHEGLGFVRLDGVREGLLVGEPLPMLFGIETIAGSIERG